MDKRFYKETKDILENYCFKVFREKDNVLRTHAIDSKFEISDYYCYFTIITPNEANLFSYFCLYSHALNVLLENYPLFNKYQDLYLRMMYIPSEEIVIFKENTVYKVLLDKVSKVLEKIEGME